MGLFKAGLPAILRRSEAEKPAETAGGLARHFSLPVERRSPPPLQPEPVPAPHRPAKPAPPPKPAPRSKLVFAFDATASRQDAWNTAQPLTDALLEAVPGQLDLALAVHGGSRVHTFTSFTSNPQRLRDRAAAVQCMAGETRLLEIIARVLKIKDVSTLVYIGDVFEESERLGLRLADKLKAHGTRLIILHDWPDVFTNEKGIFAEMAARSGGTILPFEASSLPKLQQLLAAVAVLAVGDVAALEAQEASQPGAKVLIKALADSAQLLIGNGGAR